ncbi:MAG: hypothetical protein HYS12_13535 [Planctomycetes bacterium]|nr:hypothetical protein [Planctomycetota bacterium]
MKEPRPPGLLDRAVSTWPLLAGVVFAFLGCCLAGRLVSQRNPYKWFTRFHRYVHPETHVYPTASQVRSLARQRLDPKKVAVIVGGNSILHGVGQRVQHVWTRRLQKLLGDDYCVLNLAVFSAEPAEFGAIVAEALDGEYRKMIFLTAFGSGKGTGTPDGTLYRYFYYDALYKGMLPADAQRDAHLAALNEERTKTEGEKSVELRRGRHLDSALYFEDLWTTCTLKWFNTTWSPLLVAGVTAPHLVYADIGGPLEVSHPPAERERARRIVRGFAESLGPLVFGPSLPPRGQRKGLRPDPTQSPLVRDLETCFPAPTRRRTLILVTHDSPFYVNELAPAAREEYAWAVAKAAEVLEAAGYGALDVCGDFAVRDFDDQLHLSESGGNKLADRVAPKIRAMARRLGYLGQKEE